MNLAHKIQLFPTKKQENFFVRACGVSRFTYNWALSEWSRQYEAGEQPTYLKLKKNFNQIKKAQFPWIYESPKDANQQAFSNLNTAFQRFFNNKSKYPTFKKKHGKDSFYLSNHQIVLKGKFIKIPLLDHIKMAESLRFYGKIMSATISRTADKWYVSISMEIDDINKDRTSNNTIAIDFGLKTLITDQDGNQIHSPKPLKNNLKKLARYQRQYARKILGSKNKKKQALKVAKLHARIVNIRGDFSHKTSTTICRENQTIILEDLNLNGWHKMFGKSAVDTNIGEIRRQIFYKSKVYNNNVIILNKWLPTSKTCSNCGCWKAIKLSNRIYDCEHCGLSIDRDHNAAINILKAGQIELNKIGMANPKLTPLDMEPLDQNIDLSSMVELGNNEDVYLCTPIIKQLM